MVVSSGNKRCATVRISEQELQRQLDFSRGQGCQDLVERARAYVAIGKTVVGVIQEVEDLRPELKLPRLTDRNIFERREVPVRIARPLRNISSG